MDERRRYDDRNDRDEDRPRRRRRRRDDRQEAREVVYFPGLWLELCGWIGALVLMGGAMFWLLVSAGAKNNPNANNDDEITGIVLALISGLSAIPYAVVMVVGGRKMRALSGYGWAMIASIGGISSVVLFPFACVFAFVPVVFGVWGLVALANPVVSLAFEENARGSNGRED
ncbi:hypothetical protein C1280_32720 [Gemmata obscuriglobus]|uniref:DUF4064 domain-containing protein n=1 Tax=Gemmata obscuriglobus TaxID=114 RepID=A0A2Z3HA40_9BACT|nr:hypothetical protein C1280_32720 [Gemmata obscuriglobus]